MSLPDKKKATLNALRARLEATSGIRNISFSVGAPISDNGMSTGFFLTEKGSEEELMVSCLRRSIDIISKPMISNWLLEDGLMRMMKNLPTLTYLKKIERLFMLLNEAAARKLGFQNPDDDHW